MRQRSKLGHSPRPAAACHIKPKVVLAVLMLCGILSIYFYYVILSPYPPEYKRSTLVCNVRMHFEEMTLQSEVTSYSKYVSSVQLVRSLRKYEYTQGTNPPHLQEHHANTTATEQGGHGVAGKLQEGVGAEEVDLIGTGKAEEGHGGKGRKGTGPGEGHTVMGHEGSRHEGEEPKVGPTVSIALGITSAQMPADLSGEEMLRKFPTFTQLVPSFCGTASCGVRYRFYFAYDADDALFTQPLQRDTFRTELWKMLADLCPRGIVVDVIRLIQCRHSHKPAWAQSDASYAAYLDGTDYTYRVNDDSVMISGGWTEVFVRGLGEMRPPGLGVVGPRHSGGETAILTYDFTHRTHIDIFGIHYPRLFTDWTGDTWITYTYMPGHLRKIDEVRLQHSMSLGRRYDFHSKAKFLPEIVAGSRDTIRRYVAALERGTRAEAGWVVAMALYGDDPHDLQGAVRNAQLRAVVLPRWTLRIYVPDPASAHRVPEPYVQTLLRLGAEVRYVGMGSGTGGAGLGIALRHMALLVAEDPAVERFLIRSPRQRFQEREEELVDSWVKSKAGFMTIRDHEKQVSDKPSPEMYGAVSSWLRQRIPNVIEILRAINQKDMVFLKRENIPITATIEEVLWAKVGKDAVFYDSVSCDLANHVYFKPRTNATEDFIGERFGEFGEITDEEAHNAITVEIC